MHSKLLLFTDYHDTDKLVDAINYCNGHYDTQAYLSQEKSTYLLEFVLKSQQAELVATSF
ncbi:hypothetical protein [Facklamia hominis]|uniref:hypothetical protein n=1 Tax=Facklamia hominis TaxID=178214 RepID=UPI0038FC6A26